MWKWFIHWLLQPRGSRAPRGWHPTRHRFDDTH